MKKLLIIPLLFLLTGCWNYNELNELAIITGVSVDIEDDKKTKWNFPCGHFIDGQDNVMYRFECDM